jgi:hypothetical protein
MKTIKVISGNHLTQSDKAVIKQMFCQGLIDAKTGKKQYNIYKEDTGLYNIKIVTKDRGLGFIGSPLRISVYNSKVEIR